MKLWKRLTALCLSALVCVTLLTACGRKESTDGRASLSVCVGETPATYDPIYAQQIGDQTILNHLYENLMRLETGENGQTIAVPGCRQKRGHEGEQRWHRHLHLPPPRRQVVRWRRGQGQRLCIRLAASGGPRHRLRVCPAAVHCQRLCGGSGLWRHESAGGERKKQHHPCGDPDRSL